MCSRLLLTAAPGKTLATYNGERYDRISVDTRCEITRDYNDKLSADVVSFANSDKPGVVVIAPAKKCSDGMAGEFTDVVPEGTLIIEYVAPAAAE